MSTVCVTVVVMGDQASQPIHCILWKQQHPYDGESIDVKFNFPSRNEEGAEDNKREVKQKMRAGAAERWQTLPSASAARTA